MSNIQFKSSKIDIISGMSINVPDDWRLHSSIQNEAEFKMQPILEDLYNLHRTCINKLNKLSELDTATRCDLQFRKSCICEAFKTLTKMLFREVDLIQSDKIIDSVRYVEEREGYVMYVLNRRV